MSAVQLTGVIVISEGSEDDLCGAPTQATSNLLCALRVFRRPACLGKITPSSPGLSPKRATTETWRLSFGLRRALHALARSPGLL